MDSIRKRLEAALGGEPIHDPVFAVSDWFVKNRKIDWEDLFSRGLAQVKHASLIRADYPNVHMEETIGKDEEGRDIGWITDMDEFHEWYRDEWRQEYPVKRRDDYRVLAR